jgi:hypothetical protein
MGMARVVVVSNGGSSGTSVMPASSSGSHGLEGQGWLGTRHTCMHWVVVGEADLAAAVLLLWP